MAAQTTNRSALITLVTAAVLSIAAPVKLPAGTKSDAGSRLVAAYPDHLERVEGNDLIWRDGTRMQIDDGQEQKSFEELLNAPDINDILAIPYTPGDPTTQPAVNEDPGRARPAAFYDKMYGDCRKGAVKANLIEIIWLPKKSGEKLQVTKINGVAGKLQAVSAELDELPGNFDVFLKPAAGTYNCRVIAGTDRVSTHGHGIAIDIAIKRAHYWRWSKASPDGSYPYTNEIPFEIVRIFEKHGFIWGGKWYHYDTMHFEYRPELLLQ